MPTATRPAQLQVPPGQLELTDGPSSDQPDHKHAYRELLAGDNEQELVGANLQDRLVQVGIDPVTGEPQFEPVPVPASMSAGNARGSVRFFAMFAPGGSHAGSPDPCRVEARLRMARRRGAILQRPIRRAARLAK